MSGEIRFALDRSARRIDADGRLHVDCTNISKACVNPYYGREIPRSSALGLDPEKLYYMLRDPAELAKGAATFNNVQLIDLHPPSGVSAKDPKKDQTVGSTGTDANFDGEYLTNSLVVWDADAIERIDNHKQKELSCGYRYDADMTPGTYKGLRHDGIMRNIIANHVALVPEGRAGPDVVVADGAIGEKPMKITSKKALMVQGAIAAYVRPLIAADAKLVITPALDGVTRETFKAKKSSIADRIAKDHKLDADGKAGLMIALDAMEDVDCEGEDSMEAEDAEESDEEKAEREAKEAAKDKRAKDKKARDKKAKDAEEDEAKPHGSDGEEDDDKEKAMDARIEKVRKDTIAEMNAIATAKSEVAPHVGEVTAAMDSAADVYKFALDQAGVETKGVHPSAYRSMVKMLPDPDAVAPTTFARDAKTAQGVSSKFPALQNIRQSA